MNNKHRYPENWYDEIRPAILKRDNFRCKKCGVRHKKCYIFEKDGSYIQVDEAEMKEAKANGEKAYKVFLQVAHKDHNEQNNNPKNLVSFCPKCHLNYDRKNNYIRKKAKFLDK